MKHLLLLLILATVTPFVAFGGNEPCDPTVIDGQMTDFITYATTGFTGSPVPDPPCGTYNQVDAWYQFTIGPNGDLFIFTQADVLTNAAFALYVGDCANLQLIDCVEDALCDANTMPIISFQDLVPGDQYLLRVWSENPANEGSFGLYISDTDLTVPTFNTVGSATYIDDDCIRLTPELNNQLGCAWLQEEVDFSKAFSHDMIVSFGSNQINGADGICLVYQNNGPDVCGGSGGGIGVLGILNSLVIEFDTWQNIDLSDPAEDHVAVSINGSTNHALSISAPVVLGEIEDGLEHTINFSWEPTLMQYSIEFDGALVIQNIYNVVGLVFGGDPLVFWGYTASTGGATNDHIMCPSVPVYMHGVRDTVDVVICQGDSYFAAGREQTTTGQYLDKFQSINGCDSILTTNLNVITQINTVIDTLLCAGDCIMIGSVLFCTSTIDTVAISNSTSRCDSIVVIKLQILDPIAIISPLNEIFTCLIDTIVLDGSLSSQTPNAELFWSGPDGFNSNLINPEITKSGTYELFVEVTDRNLTCRSEVVEVVVEIDTMPPLVNLSTENLPCVGSLFYRALGDENFIYSWSGPANYIADGIEIEINNAGTYFLTITDQINGCKATNSIFIFEPEALVIVDQTITEATCIQGGSVQDVLIVGGMLPLVYSLNGSAAQPTSDFFLLLPGSYQMVVTDQGGCEGELTFQIPAIDSITVLLNPSIEADEGDSIQLMAIIEPNAGVLESIEWSPATGLSCSECLSPIVIDPRITMYSIFVQDTNGCTAQASVTISYRPQLIYIPNSFSPNNDGINDSFTLFAATNSNLTVISFSIYTKWGARVFHRKNLSIQDENMAWDGTSNGELLDPGVFVFYAEVMSPSGRIEIMQGEVHLIK